MFANKKLVPRIRNQLTRLGAPVQVASLGRDLGLSLGCSRTRRLGVQNSRFAAGQARLGRVKQLVCVTKTARALITTGVVPAYTWGVASWGLSPSQLVKLRSQLASSAGLSQSRRCPLLLWRPLWALSMTQLVCLLLLVSKGLLNSGVLVFPSMLT